MLGDTELRNITLTLSIPMHAVEPGRIGRVGAGNVRKCDVGDALQVLRNRQKRLLALFRVGAFGHHKKSDGHGGSVEHESAGGGGGGQKRDKTSLRAQHCQLAQ